MQHAKTIHITSMMETTATKKAEYAEKIANNLDEDALRILAEKSIKPGMSDKLRTYQKLI